MGHQGRGRVFKVGGGSSKYEVDHQGKGWVIRVGAGHQGRGWIIKVGGRSSR